MSLQALSLPSSRSVLPTILGNSDDFSGEVISFAASNSLSDPLRHALAIAKSVFGPERRIAIALESDSESDGASIVMDVELDGDVDAALTSYRDYVERWCRSALCTPLIGLTFHFAPR